MQNYGTTAILDVKKSLPHGKQVEITSALNEKDGVRDARFSEFVSRVMIVAYSPKVISAQAIQKQVREQLDTDGPATCLVDF
ncbi:MAG: hypothetical protein ACWGOV_06665 [Acidiferrobacterales bacterium]